MTYSKVDMETRRLYQPTFMREHCMEARCDRVVTVGLFLKDVTCIIRLC